MSGLVSVLSKFGFQPYSLLSAKYNYSSCYPPERHSYEPSRYSVLLAFLWRSFNVEYTGTHFVEWVSRLRYSYPHVFAAGKVLSKTGKTFTEGLHPDPPNNRYLPWVNAYPTIWRYHLLLSSETWRIIDTLSNQTLALTRPDFMTWLLATLFALAAHPVEPNLRTPTKSQQIEDFYDFVEFILSDSDLFVAGEPLKSSDIKVPTTSAVKKFCHEVKNSTHTCWDDYDPSWYAAAVAYLYDEDDIEFVPLLQPHCRQCIPIRAAQTFAVETLDANSFHSSLENLLCTLVSFPQHCGFSLIDITEESIRQTGGDCFVKTNIRSHRGTQVFSTCPTHLKSV